MGYRLSADIGGTFTDLVLLDEAGELHVHKTPSTPHDFTEGILTGVGRILGDRDAGAGLADVDSFVHGATVVLNALLQVDLPDTGLVTTAGFRDVLEIMRTNNPAMYDLRHVKPAPLVPRRLRFEVRERMRHSGEVHSALCEDDVRAAAEQLRAAGVRAVGVCLLHAYANAAHERRVGEILADELPGVTVCLSSDVAPEWREFERASTTVVNAATVPIIRSYLERLSTSLADAGLRRDLLVMQSNGGVMTTAAAREWPVRTVMSGPSGGVVGALELAREIDCPNVVTIDIGGTSSDMGVIAGGRAVTVVESTVADGWPIIAPMIEIVSIGAGGGSIAWIDDGGGLRVGPRSAGAAPGPVAYGRGGVEPTVSDANLVLGRIDPDHFLGGEMALDVEAARDAIEARVAEPLGLGVMEAAEGIVRIANTTMAKAMRSILVERGHDPRDFALMGFGGGGGLHAAAVMRELDIPHAVIPSNPGALSAIGMLSTDFRHDRARTLVRAVAELDGAELETTFRMLEDEAAAMLAAEGVGADRRRLERSVDLRYVGQQDHLNVPCPPRGAALDPAALTDALHGAHARAYGYATPEFAAEVVNVRVTGVGHTGGVDLPRLRGRDAGSARRATGARDVWFGEADGTLETEIVLIEDVRAGDVVTGPAIVEDPRSTMLVLPGQTGRFDDLRNLHIHEVTA